jgi:hypothetical protein
MGLGQRRGQDLKIDPAPEGVFIKILVHDIPDVAPNSLPLWTFGRKTNEVWEIALWDFASGGFVAAPKGRPTEWLNLTEWEVVHHQGQLNQLVW